MRRHYSLILAFCWIGLGVCLFWPEVLPEKARAHLKGIGGGFVGALAFLLAIYNFVRWQSMRSLDRNRAAARAVNPLAVRKVEPEPEKYEPNPELNFVKLPEDEATPKDASGP